MLATNYRSLILVKRQFSITSSLLKKNSSSRKGSHDKGNSKNGAGQVDEEVEIIDVKGYIADATKLFDESLELHNKKLNEIKQGRANPKIFDGLKLHNGASFKDVAHTSLRGKNSLLITVYDPKDAKNVISAIMGAGLNLNPEKDPNNSQLLKVLLPPPTTESRMNLVKELKIVFESFKSSSMRNSLASVRADILKEMKKLDKKDDSVRKAMQDLEKLHKDYAKKLQDQLKQAEKTLMS
ncbi:hypothetical protein Kpol_1004p67 [Vanderwaltozyma polyspora DSM 70294]|uniref:Ribosome-recycling factor, mitochondrial n=1 Tax=Vanderwaltozyma polyspora (strain ATCC 22028 / DSM 70294 / BCRC 21397 / CBS 2163 / NBRC 10782 / NRRL Y-8283 / UCD 57-17) TaxID=436907 RepID=A7TJC1_VANPO|nr:uncharacterized protein Kpol_1004p67 [Vanderwaltozyma polyspora DSM 70294]EDO17690.1 hypothetical protein Kpol_1004p67 [Vanderwaltozyma polyspora DSM 70294]